MEGDFANMQPKIQKKYVMIDWDDTMSLNPNMVKPLFALFSQFGFIPKIFTARKESDDNSDIFIYVEKDDVLFADREQKKNAALFKYGIKNADIAFWIDDLPTSIIDSEDVGNMLFLIN